MAECELYLTIWRETRTQNIKLLLKHTLFFSKGAYQLIVTPNLTPYVLCIIYYQLTHIHFYNMYKN